MYLTTHLLHVTDINCGVARICKPSNIAYMKLSNQRFYDVDAGEPFYESAAAVAIGDDYTHIDTDFRRLYKRPFLWTTRFYNGLTLAAFSQDMHYHIIDKTGRAQFGGMTFAQVWPFTRNYITLLRNHDDIYYFLLATSKVLCSPREMLRMISTMPEGFETLYAYLLAEHKDDDYTQEILKKPDVHAIFLYDFLAHKWNI